MQLPVGVRPGGSFSIERRRAGAQAEAEAPKSQVRRLRAATCLANSAQREAQLARADRRGHIELLWTWL